MAMMCRVKKSIALSVFAVGIVFAQSPSRWQNLCPTYTGLAYDGSKFVAVSGDGLVRTTSDGAEWSHYFNFSDANEEDGDTRRIYTVAYGEGQFVGVQNNSRYLRSEDGFNWRSVPSTLPANAVWKNMVFGTVEDGWAFVAIDTAKRAAWFDEFDWNPTNVGISLSHAAFGGGRFVVAGDGSKASTNGITWSGSSTTQISVVAFGGENKFVALSKTGSAHTSSDGRDWTRASGTDAPAGMTDMVFGGGKFVAVGEKGKGAVSSDGSSWTAITTLNADDDFTAVKYGNNMFLALGAKGSVYTSPDGSAWTKKSGNSAMSYKQIVYGNSKYVAVGDSGVSVSPDGLKWERKGNLKNLTGVAFGAGKFVVVSDNGAVASSPDGEAWPDGRVFDEVIFTSVAFGNNTFIAGGKTPGVAVSSKVVVYKSTDGENWSSYDLIAMSGWKQGQHIASLCFGDGKFLAAVGGITDSLKYCNASGTDIGKYWDPVTDLPGVGSGYNMVSAVYADNKFVVLGTKGTGAAGEAVVLNSAAADNGWAATTIQNIKDVKAATIAKDKYVVVGNFGNIYAYVNNSWVSQGRVTNRNLSTIYSANDVILAAGAGGAMLYSTAVPTSVRHASTPRAASAPKGAVMSLDRFGRTSSVTLSFTPNSAGELAVYSLSGRRIYRARLGAGERSVRLPERVMSNGSLLVRYSGGGRVVSQRFQTVR